MTVRPFAERLIRHWKEDLEILRRYGCETQVMVLCSVIEDVRQEAARFDAEALTLEQAAEESGYSYSSLQRKVRKGEIPNAGKKGSPRICRKHLPRKPPPALSKRSEKDETGGPDLLDLMT